MKLTKSVPWSMVYASKPECPEHSHREAEHAVHQALSQIKVPVMQASEPSFPELKCC